MPSKAKILCSPLSSMLRTVMLRPLIMLAAVLLASCAALPPTETAPVDPEASLAMPMAMNEFVIDPAHDDVIGEPQVIRVRKEDTLSDIARHFNVGYEELVAANPDVDPWLPKAGTEIVVPTQWVLPDVPRTGIVINLAAMRLFYFPKAAKGEPQRVITHPVGIGRVEWETPLGKTRVIAKNEAPTWIPTANIRREHAENGDPLPAKVPPGPNNPMGTHVLRLGWAEYAIHGTNQPASIGLRGTHGCLRMYPEDIEKMYTAVPVGTPVTVLDEPNLAGLRDDTLYLQSYPVLEDDKRNHNKRANTLIKSYLKRKTKIHKQAMPTVNNQLVDEIMQKPRALTLPVSIAGMSVQQFIDQAPKVRNSLPQNTSWSGEEEKTAVEVTPSLNGLSSAQP